MTSPPRTDRPTKWRFQFGLRSILILILLTCIGSSFYRRHTAYEAIDTIQKKAGFVRPAPKAKGWKRIFSNDVYRVYHLSFHNSFGVTDYDVAAITRLPWLRRLSLHRTKVSDKSAEYVAKLRLLEALSFERTAITNKGLESLAKLNKLTSLSLNHTGITETGLSHLSELVEMETLLLKGIELNTLEHFANMKKLKRVELGALNEPDSLASFEHMTQMETLVLPKTAVSNSDFRYLRNMSKLKIIRLTASRLSDLSEETWQRYPKIEELQVNVDGEFHIRGQKRLTILSLRGRPTAMSLRNLPQLYNLRLPTTPVEAMHAEDCPKLTYLTANAKRVTLKQLPELSSLAIRKTESLETEGLPNLQSISFNGTILSPDFFAGLESPGKIVSLSFVHTSGDVNILNAFPDFPSVQALSFGNHRISPHRTHRQLTPDESQKFALFLSKFPALEQIELSESLSTKEVLTSLLKIEALNQIQITCLNLESKSYLQLLELPNIQRLVVRDKARRSYHYEFVPGGKIIPPNRKLRVVNGRSFVSLW